jgi:hypothetical protein
MVEAIMIHRTRSVPCFILMLVLALGCAEKPGSFTLALTWDPAPEDVVWLELQVQHRPDGQSSGPVLASLEPAPYVPGAPLQLVLPSVPNGSDRVVVIEGREVADLNARPIYYGISEPFSIRPGKKTEVQVPMVFQQPVTDRYPSSIELVVNDHEGPEFIKLEDAKAASLRLTMTGASQVIIANNAALSTHRTELSVDDEQLVCDKSEDGDSQTCEVAVWDLTVGVSPEPVHGDTLSVYVAFVDMKGYQSDILSASTVLDTEPPALSGTPEFVRIDNKQSAQLSLNSVLAARETDVKVTVSLTEIPGSLPTIVDVGATINNVSWEEDAAVFSFTVEEGPEEPTDLLLVTVVSDLAGNEAELELGTIVYDYDIPTGFAAGAMGQAVHHRAPWGSRESVGTSHAEVRFCPELNLPEPTEPDCTWLDTAPFPEDEIVVVEANAGPGTWSCSQNELVRGSLSSIQSSQSLPVPPTALAVCVYMSDTAGNQSEVVLVETGQWTGSLAPSSSEGTKSPHNAWDLPTWQASLDQGDMKVALDPDQRTALATPTGEPLELKTRRPWRKIIGSEPPDIGVADTALAWDADRGVLVQFGGAPVFTSDVQQDIWEFRNGTWEYPAMGISPPGRTGHTLTYDPVRHGVVMIGGREAGDYDPSSSLWLWNGESWLELQLENSGPGGRHQHATTYDSNRGRLILFGGMVDDTEDNDLWALSGNQWLLLDDNNSGPAPRYSAALAYDPAQDRIWLWGGNQDDGTTDNILWSWQDGLWQQHGSYDENVPVKGKGTLAYADFWSSLWLKESSFKIWQFSGKHWAKQDLWEDDFETDAAMSPDGNQRGIMMVGNHWYDFEEHVLAQFNGETLFRRHASTDSPPLRSKHMMLFDPMNEVSYLVGGIHISLGKYFSDCWTFDGTGWFSGEGECELPAPLFAYAMALHPNSNRPIIYGGVETYCAPPMCEPSKQLLVLENSGWEVQDTGNGPPGLFSPAMATDDYSKTLVLFGGWSKMSAEALATTWLLTSDGWELLPDDVDAPPGRGEHTMSYDSIRHKVILFGGWEKYGPSKLYDDTWEWNQYHGWVEASPIGPIPPARHRHAMAYDSSRGRTVIFGGTPNTEEGYLSDVWEWNGKRWSEIATTAGPDARAEHSFVYDPHLSSFVLFGGTEGAEEAWLLDSSPELAPGLVARFNVYADLPNGAHPVQLEVSTTSGGRGAGIMLDPDEGEIAGDLVPGTTLAAWDAAAGKWQVIATNQADSSELTSLSWISQSTWWLPRLLDGGLGLNLMVRPTAPDGNGIDPAQVLVGFLEAQIIYSLGTPAGCKPDCAARHCGSDGCDGTCGTCPTGESCSVAGWCILEDLTDWTCDPLLLDAGDGCDCLCGFIDNDCGAEPFPAFGCPGPGFACSQTGECVCAPQCNGKKCGEDGCGGTCGSCLENWVCNGEGTCVDPNVTPVWTCDPEYFEDTLCDCECGIPDPACEDNPFMTFNCSSGYGCSPEGKCICIPDCDDKDPCEPDGCGWLCNTCPVETPFCVDGACTAKCSPDCTTAECGDDGCGGSCGDCSFGTCVNGLCSDGDLGSPCNSVSDCDLGGEFTSTCWQGFCSQSCWDWTEMKPYEGSCEGASEMTVFGDAYFCSSTFGKCYPGEPEVQFCESEIECEESGLTCANAYNEPWGSTTIIGGCQPDFKLTLAPGEPCNGYKDCSSGICYTFSEDDTECGYYCMSDADCPEGRFCLALGFGVDDDPLPDAWAGHCRAWPGSLLECGEQSDCPAGETCIAVIDPATLQARYICGEGYIGGKDIGEPCTSNDECFSTWCYQPPDGYSGTGYCTNACQNGPADCTNGLHCFEDGILHEGGTPDDNSDDALYGFCVYGSTDDFCPIAESGWCNSGFTCEPAAALPDDFGLCTKQ